MHLTCQDKQLRVRRLTIGWEWSSVGIRVARCRARAAMQRSGRRMRRSRASFLPTGTGVSPGSSGAVPGAGNNVPEWGAVAREWEAHGAEWGADVTVCEWCGRRFGAGRWGPGAGRLSLPAYNLKFPRTAGKSWYDCHLRDFFHGARRLLAAGNGRFGGEKSHQGNSSRQEPVGVAFVGGTIGHRLLRPTRPSYPQRHPQPPACGWASSMAYSQESHESMEALVRLTLADFFSRGTALARWGR